MLAMTLVVFMSVPMASSLQRNLLIWKLSHIEAPRLFSITWRRRIEEHVQSLALNSILAFSCYPPASHMFSHKLCVSYHTITFSIFAFITILRDYNDLMWLSKFIISNKINFSVLQVIYTGVLPLKLNSHNPWSSFSVHVPPAQWRAMVIYNLIHEIVF